MTIESTIFDTLKGLVSNRCYPDQAPEVVGKPYIVYQQVGGQAVNFLDTATLPGKGLPRFRISIWGVTRAEVAALAKQAETALRQVASLQTTVEGEPTAVTDDETKLRGSQQDFSFCA